MSVRPPLERASSVLRFDAVQRGAHWVNAALFGVVMFTAIPLYFGSFFGVVFPRHTIEQIHLWCGVALPLPLLVSMAGPWGRAMRDDVRRFVLWTHGEIKWLLTLGRAPLRAGKFNPGQKANAIFVAASIVVMLVTGLMLQWFRLVPVTWRTGATFTHDLFAWAIFIVVIGHVFMAVTHPRSLQSMVTGTVDEEWADQHAPAWRDGVDRASRDA